MEPQRTVQSPSLSKKRALFQRARACHVFREQRPCKIGIAVRDGPFHCDDFHPSKRPCDRIRWRPLMTTIEELHPMRAGRPRQLLLNLLHFHEVEIRVPSRAEPCERFRFGLFRLWVRLARHDDACDLSCLVHGKGVAPPE